MTVEQVASELAEAEGRERSAIRFPYMDLGEAAAVAKAVHETTGSSPCELDKLAAHLDLSIKSSGFQVRLATARLFGVIESASGGVKLTPLGEKIIDSAQERAAKVSAFLAVPLYSKLYEHYRGKLIPPPAAFERELQGMGVPQKQTGKARQVFERSAQSAGFFEYGKDKLIAPTVTPAAHTASPTGHEHSGGSGGGGAGSGGAGSGEGGNGTGLNLDPLLLALLEKIPPTKEGWPSAKRIRWFKTFAMNVSQIYDADEDNPVEMTITGTAETGNG